jgi:hypothetical protein
VTFASEKKMDPDTLLAQVATLSTWNSEGNFALPPKRHVVGELLRVPQRAMLFLQEGGLGRGGRYAGYTAVPGVPVPPSSKVATNYILYNSAWGDRVRKVVLVDNEGRAPVGGAITGRTPAAVAAGNNLFVSWHALSAADNLDTAALFRTLQKGDAYRDWNQIVVGGGFNATPSDIRRILKTVEEEGGSSNFAAQIVASRQPTVKTWQKEFDFFVFFRKSIESQDAGLVRTGIGNHQVVRTNLVLP